MITKGNCCRAATEQHKGVSIKVRILNIFSNSYTGTQYIVYIIIMKQYIVFHLFYGTIYCNYIVDIPYIVYYIMKNKYILLYK